MWSPREAVEIFHLLFLQAFGLRVDKALYALKGGGNLRFFHLIQRYRLYPIRVQHYTTEAAFRQKISALASRKQTQARDVFDLKLLLDAGEGRKPVPAGTSKSLPGAMENAVGVGYDQFVSQVWAYLAPEDQEDYRDRKIWEALQEEVVNALQALRL
jgi:hypothetical protein